MGSCFTKPTEAEFCLLDNNPVRSLGSQQITIGGPDKQRLKALWLDMLGLTVAFPSPYRRLPVKSTCVGQRDNVDEDICFIHRKGHEAFPLGSDGVLIGLVTI